MKKIQLILLFSRNFLQQVDFIKDKNVRATGYRWKHSNSIDHFKQSERTFRLCYNCFRIDQGEI